MLRHILALTSGEWSAWSYEGDGNCSVTCGKGVRWMSRDCINGDAACLSCAQYASEACNGTQCPGNNNSLSWFVSVMCNVQVFSQKNE